MTRSRWDDVGDDAWPDDAAWARGLGCDEDEFGREEDIPESGRDWRRPQGIFVIAPLSGEAAEQIHAIQRRYDPKLAAMSAPHVTLVGSSGAGPVVPGTTEAQLRAAIEPVARETAPLVLPFGRPSRFMQTNIVSLPLDPNGPLRELFERLRASGLRFGPVRFAFTPHATLSYFPTLDRARERALLAERVTAPAVIDRLELSLTHDPQPPKRLFEVRLGAMSDN
ncbi:MAG TPA: 2'-5' RNA ligase family protein [Gemmatimonadaceae bacterium]|nr:2'-5' RNA ligase family protein [Gemmatimonadaceae bacterium]